MFRVVHTHIVIHKCVYKTCNQVFAFLILATIISDPIKKIGKIQKDPMIYNNLRYCQVVMP